ncbi:hypothetical protein JCM24511_02003 [Saitozyma sp. JCM 24511]|nr:hypothetical protein JCM24511_02003 [Saitozyma sp. JCM 24511]
MGYGVVLGKTFAVGDITPERQSLVTMANEVARRLLSSVKAGMRSWELTTLIENFLRSSGFKGVQGLAAHNHERWDIQGPKTINLWPTAAQRDDTLNDITFQEGEVYTFEVWLTSDNHPEPREASEMETTLYQYLGSRTNLDLTTLPSAEADVAKYCDAQFASFPFNVREVGIEVGPATWRKLQERGSLGIYPPFVVKSKGASVAQCVASFVVTANGTVCLSNEILH